MSGIGSLFGGLFSKRAAAEPATAPVAEAPAPVEAPRPAAFPQTRSECAARYGEIIDGIWAKQDAWMTYVPVPDDIGAVWKLDGKTPITRIYCNKDMAGPLADAMYNLKLRGCVKELKSFDGCFNIRSTRGSTSQSAHSWGVALDLNCDTNPLGGKSSLSDQFIRCWTDAGFFYGGNFKSRPDPMHMTLVGF